MIYLLDTNAISDLVGFDPQVRKHYQQALIRGDTLGICRPVYYELLRGLIWKGANRKLSILRDEFLPLFKWLPLLDQDWEQAARFWAAAVSEGKQLADMDHLLAALGYRLAAVIASSDLDFDALPVKRENWRIP